ncbi:hypothetical protein VTL71DRAFT_2580, partial [Oculimacula yallundae]
MATDPRPDEPPTSLVRRGGGVKFRFEAWLKDQSIPSLRHDQSLAGFIQDWTAVFDDLDEMMFARLKRPVLKEAHDEY